VAPSTSKGEWNNASVVRLEDAMFGASDELNVDVVTREREVAIQVSGDVDLATSPQLESVLDRFANDGTGAVTLDLSRVTFFDSSGIRVLVAAKHRYDDLGRPLGLTELSEPVRRVLRLAGLHETFGLSDGD
jgi:anti-sigma B factor antagonist